MLLNYFRKQRASIYHPATIDDIPFEVLREAFLYLEPEELVSPSRVNRSWRPAAQDVQRSRLQISEGEIDRLDTSSICGIQLMRIVFGHESFSIKHLELDLELVPQKYIHLLARIVPSLRTLDLSFKYREESGVCYAILDLFFSQCNGIRNLKLVIFDFGDDSSSISQTIKDGFYQLSQLSLSQGSGDIKSFVENVPIPNLGSFSNRLWSGRNRDIVSAVATNYPTIKRLSLEDDSTTLLHKFLKECRDIELISYRNDVGKMVKSDLEAVVSLPCLKSLNIYCHLDDDALDILYLYKGSHLAIGPRPCNLNTFLGTIRGNLVGLDYTSSISIVDAADVIVEFCPNLQTLDIKSGEEEENHTSLARNKLKRGLNKLKRGLKKLSKLKVDSKSIFLGTDWKGGYD
jgi:hypothetical protein